MNTSVFLITSLIIILIPGTGVIYTVSLGMSEGRKKAFFAALGCTAGILPHLCISIVLSSLLMRMDDRVFLAVKYIGVLYLIYLGAGMIFSKGKIQRLARCLFGVLFFVFWKRVLPACRQSFSGE